MATQWPEAAARASRLSNRKPLAHPPGQREPSDPLQGASGERVTPNPPSALRPEGGPGTRRPWQARTTPPQPRHKGTAAPNLLGTAAGSATQRKGAHARAALNKTQTHANRRRRETQPAARTIQVKLATQSAIQTVQNLSTTGTLLYRTEQTQHPQSSDPAMGSCEAQLLGNSST